MIDEAKILKDDTDTAAQRRMRDPVGGRRVDVEQGNGSARGRLGQADDFKQRRLAGAADPRQEIKPTGIERQRDVVQDFRVGAVMLADVVQPDHACLRDSPKYPAPTSSVRRSRPW